MSTPDDATPKTAMTTPGGQMVLSERIAQFRRLYRWLNLTLIHQGIWPLLLLISAAPVGTPGEIRMPWYLARLGAPALACGFALFYLRHLPDVAEDRDSAAPSANGRPSIAIQVKVALFALTAMLLVARLAAGPTTPALKLILFGAADVLAFQLIHFEVVRRSWRDPAYGIGMAVFFFGLSWGLRDMMLTLLGPSEASPALALLGGLVLGVLVGIGSRLLRIWPGGFWTAAAAQFLLVYLVIGFIDR